MSVIAIESDEEFDKLISKTKPSVVLFSADWVEQCKQVYEILHELGKLLGGKLTFAKITAENFPDISMRNKIDAVPTVIFFSNGISVERVEGVDIAALTAKCKSIAATELSKQPLEERLKSLINKAPLMIFMKGDRNAPRCGFSRQLIEIVNELGLPYETFDILSDEEVRQGLKTFSDWPTYPQVYVNGDLLGGLDIIKELKESNELEAALKGESTSN